jgi:predicted nuclease of restriction endonuclease-like RecB superfamily
MEKTRQVAQSRSLLQEIADSGEVMGKLFPKLWDSEKKAWKLSDSAKIPSPNQAVEKLAGLIHVKFEKTGSAFRIETKTHDPRFSQRLNLLFVKALNERLRRVALQESQKNQEYLREKVGEYTDPYLRNKLESLAAAELERAMLINSEAVEIIDAPIVPEGKSAPKRSLITVSFGITGFLLAAFGSLAFSLFRENQPEAIGEIA